MGDATTIRPEELLAHVDWVRRLAAELVAGAANAEDVAQETWRRTLERPPRHAGDLRRWLAAAARNVARQFGRAATTRRIHEAKALTGSPDPSADELVARAQLQRRVVDAVLSLEPLYREPLLARYFDDQRPARIAARLGVPVETVKTRLKRGLELVRGSLVAGRAVQPTRRELARALAPLLAMRVLGVTTRAATTWKCAAAILAATTLVLFTSLSTGSPSRSEVQGAGTPVPRPDANVSDAGAPIAAARVPAFATDGASATSPVPLLRGFIASSNGEVVSPATITWRDGASLSRVDVTGGEYAIAGLPGGVVPFRVSAAGFLPLDVTLDLGSMDGTRRHDFVLGPSIIVPIRIVAPDGSSVQSYGEEAGTTIPAFFLSVAATDVPLPDELPATTWSARPGVTAQGRAYIVGGPTAPFGYGPGIAPGTDGVLEVGHRPVETALLLRDVVLARRRLTAADSEVVFTVDPSRVACLWGGVKCTCVDADTGAPLPGVRVEVSTYSECGRHVMSGEDGGVEIRPLAPGWFDLVVSAAGREFRSEFVLVHSGETLDLGKLPLDRERTITGSITSIKGSPAHAEFTALRLDRHVRGQPFGSHRYFGSGEDGKLKIGGLGRGRYVIQGPAPLYDEPNDGAALFVVDLTSASESHVDLQLVPETSVCIAPRVGQGEMLYAEVRTAAGDLVHADHVVEGGLYLRLPEGDYAAAVFELPADGPPLRSIPFRAIGPRLVVEFDPRDAMPAKLATPDVNEVRVGRMEVPVPTTPVPPTASVRRETSRVVVGRVTDREGVAIVGADVTVGAASGRVTKSSARGDFALAGIPSGPIRVTATARGFIEADPIGLTGSEPLSVIHVALDRATLVQIRATDLDGVPLVQPPGLNLYVIATRDLPDAKVGATAELPCLFDQSSRTRGYTGRLEIKVPLPVYVSLVSSRIVLATVRLAEPVEELTLAVDPARLAAVASGHGESSDQR